MAASKSDYRPPKEVKRKHKTLLEDIGKKLEKLRRNKGLTAEKLSTNFEVSRNSYRLMEKGETYFSLYNLLKILDKHGIDFQTFMNTDVEDL